MRAFKWQAAARKLGLPRSAIDARDRKIALDVNWVNNGRRITPDARPAASWTARWLFMLQNVITTLGLL